MPLLVLFGCLFVVFGLLGLASDDDAWGQLWAGLSTVSLGGFGISLAWDALRTGQIRLQFSIIRRASQPRSFWSAVALVAVAGVVTVMAGLWLLFVKG